MNKQLKLRCPACLNLLRSDGPGRFSCPSCGYHSVLRPNNSFRCKESKK